MMDDKFRNRILAFYVAGFLNLALGLYVLINGRALVEQTMWYVLLLFFFGFAAVDFWFARNLRKKWMEAYRELTARRQAGTGKDDGASTRDERQKA